MTDNARSDSDTSVVARKRMVQVGSILLVQVLALFVLSGNPRWVWAWAYFGLSLLVWSSTGSLFSGATRS
jgi:hypothetical protein